MEQHKIPQVDLDRQRTTGFLLGLVLVLALLFVALEWNSMPTEAPVDEELDIHDMVHEEDQVPMSVEQQMAAMPPARPKAEEGAQLRVVDDNVELAPEEPDRPSATDGDKNGDDDEAPAPTTVETEDPKVLAPAGIDPNDNPQQLRIVEDLPQFPGGAVELMKWLTRNLTYPKVAQERKVQGKVVAFFYVEKDGQITGITLQHTLSTECDNEALRVLRMMPRWKPGIQDGKPCRTKVCIPIVFKL